MFAEFLNDFFASFDAWLLGIGASLHEAAGSVFDPVFSFITLFGEGGFFCIALALVLMMIPRTRKVGYTVSAAMLIGLLLTNVTLKPLIARERPYDAVELFRRYWEAVGHGPEGDYSFPSGHTNIVFCAATAIFLAGKRKYTWLCHIPAVLVGFSRIYIAVHYPSDVLGGMVTGAISGICGYFIVKAVYVRIEKRKKEKAGETAKEITEEKAKEATGEITEETTEELTGESAEESTGGSAETVSGH